MSNLFIRYGILVPIGMVFMPFFALGMLMNPIELYMEFFKYLKSGEPLGPFDGGMI